MTRIPRTRSALLIVPLAAAIPLAPAASRVTCPNDAATGGLAPILTPGRILLLGEVHGTREGPEVVAAAACIAANGDHPVTVALEIPAEEDRRIRGFLASDGGAPARDSLLQGSFWQREYQDGRSSEAMLALLESLRSLRASGASLVVTLLDSTRPFSDGQARDDWLGLHLTQAVAEAPPEAVVISLTGNVHSRRMAGVPWDAEYRPAGMAVAARWPGRTLALQLAGPTGEAWICQGSAASDCGPTRMGGASELTPGAVELLPELRDGHDGVYRLPGLTASPPAAAGGGRHDLQRTDRERPGKGPAQVTHR